MFSPFAAHLALGMIGEGPMWNPLTNQYENAAKVIADNGLQAIQMKPKVRVCHGILCDAYWHLPCKVCGVERLASL